MQFLWRDEQPRTYPRVLYIPDGTGRWRSCGQEPTYNIYFNASEQLLPRLPIPAPWREPKKTHTQALQHITKIWKTILALLYGKAIRLQTKEWSWSVLQFVADVVIYADYYGVLPSIAPGIRQCLITLPGISRYVAHHPEMFVRLAYELRDETLFVEVAKHLAGKDLENCSSWRYTLDLGLPSGRASDLELSNFLEGACGELKDLVVDFATRLTHLPDDFTCIRPDLEWTPA